MSGALVVVDVRDDGVAVITLSRPERHNAWTPELEREYFAALAELDLDQRVRTAVLTGSGSVFCPGFDIGHLATIAGTTFNQDGRESVLRPWVFRKPIVAAINGGCAGIGLVQALLCDVRFAARGARMSTSFARRGLAGEYGLTWLLPRLVGLASATDLLLSGRTFEADEAAALGLVNRVVDPERLLEVAIGYAADLAANCSPTSMALIRHQLHLDADSEFSPAMARAYRAMAAAVGGSDLAEGAASMKERRSPSYPALSDDFDPARIVGADVALASVTPARLLR